MKLTANELARLRHEDGLLEQDELADLEPHNLEADLALRARLFEVFTSVSVPPIADDVMRRIGPVGAPVGDSISEEADAPTLSLGVMERIGQADGMGGWVQQAVIEEAGAPPSLWDGLSASVGGSVNEGIGGLLKGAIEQESSDGFVGGAVFSNGRPWWKIGVAAGAALAAAAAVLFYLGFAVDAGPAVEASIGPEEIDLPE